MDALLGFVGPVPPRHWRETRKLLKEILHHASNDLAKKSISMFVVPEINSRIPSICVSYPVYSPWFLAVSNEWRTLDRASALLATIHGPKVMANGAEVPPPSSDDGSQFRPLISRDGRLALLFTCSDAGSMGNVPKHSIPITSVDTAGAILRLAETAESPRVGLAHALEEYSGVIAVALIDIEKRIVWLGHTGMEYFLLVRLDTRVMITTHPKSLLEAFAWTIGAQHVPTGPANVTHVALRTVIGIEIDTGEIIVPD